MKPKKRGKHTCLNKDVFAGWFFPFNLWQKLFFSIGMLAYGSSVLFNRLAKKITNRVE
ncbi:hypothetical protein [Bacillus pacificus]|uniref:hypothetical protein n=1 Tax=Bacillus pacificus TaxID=2026187 RepID=UPI003D64A5FB